MKKITLLSLSTMLSIVLFSFVNHTEILADEYNVNTSNSRIDWVGSKKDGFHPGTLNLKAGNVTVDNGKIVGGKFTVDMNSLKVTDGAGAKLEGHLKSPDFFNVEKFAEANFDITKVTYTTETEILIEGNLTVKGVTVPVKFPGYVRNVDDKKLFAQAFFNIDAKLLGVASKWVANDVNLNIHLFATK